VIERIELENSCFKNIDRSDYDNHIKSIWYFNSKNKWHRSNGPAKIYYYDNGKIYSEHYCINGVRHRLDGPVYIAYKGSGEIYFKEYCINGKEYSEEEFEKESKRLKNIERNLKLLDKK